MERPPIIEYGTSEPRRRRWVGLRVLMAVLTVVVCFYFWFGAMDTRMFARKWKEYGNNPALQPHIDASARAWTIQAVVVWSIATLGWSSYFILRRRANRDGEGRK